MIEGKVTTVFGDDINTDDIIPARVLQQSFEQAFFAEHAFAAFDPGFRGRCAAHPANIVVAGRNFGCGSSREQAVYALARNNVVCVVARSFPDIFYRNALTNGLVLVAVPDVSALAEGDLLTVDLDRGVVVNQACRGAPIPFDMPAGDRAIFKAGGRVGPVRSHLAELLA